MYRKLILLLVIVLASFGLMGCDAIFGTGSDTGAIRETISPQNYVSNYMDTGADHILIDVRTPAEYASGAIAGSVNIPVEQLSSRLSEVPTDKAVVVYCRSGNRSAQASQILSNAGSFNEIYDLGGIIQWTAAGYQLQLPQ